MYGNNLYGQFLFGIDSQETVNPDDYYIDLMKYLPDFYRNIKEMKELQTAFGYEVGKAVYSSQEALDQCFISTATWGLDRCEKVLGIAIDKSKSYESRREIIRAKLRGQGATTKEMIQNVAISFSGGEVAIREYPAEYRFIVQFIGVRGIPQNMVGLINAIEEIKPAHLAYSFKYTYTVWQQINMTWQEASEKTWGELRVHEGE